MAYPFALVEDDLAGDRFLGDDRTERLKLVRNEWNELCKCRASHAAVELAETGPVNSRRIGRPLCRGIRRQREHRTNRKGQVVDEAGTITFLASSKGLPEQIKTPSGPVLTRDAGIITFADTFDLETGEFISSELVLMKGPHPKRTVISRSSARCHGGALVAASTTSSDLFGGAAAQRPLFPFQCLRRAGASEPKGDPRTTLTRAPASKRLGLRGAAALRWPQGTAGDAARVVRPLTRQ
jgi:hypothetical protein